MVVSILSSTIIRTNNFVKLTLYSSATKKRAGQLTIIAQTSDLSNTLRKPFKISHNRLFYLSIAL